MSNNYPAPIHNLPSKSYPASIQMLPSPSSWSADGNCSRLPELIDGIQSGKLLHLTELKLAGCGLTELPAEISQLTMLEKFDAGGNALSDLPASFANLISLRILFFLNNRFTAVPEVLASLPKLETLSFKGNFLEEIPDGRLPPSLLALILTGNRLVSLPARMGAGLPRLRKLMLSNNALPALPDSLADCRELELLRAANNRLRALPARLLALPALAWIAVAGNPLAAAAAAAAAPPPELPAAAVRVGEKLGQGASGTVYRCSILPDVSPAAAAAAAASDGATLSLKVYHDAAAISDGSPEDELTAAAAVSHPAVQRLRAVVRDFPPADGGGAAGGKRLAAVVDWAPYGSTPLGSPPSLFTVTRDTYPDTGPLGPWLVLRGAQTLAHGLAAIHAAGVCHGDVYAHNVLVSSDRRWMRLGDFGASFFYERGGPDGAALEQIEVCAWGRLVAEMLALVPARAGPAAAAAAADDLPPGVTAAAAGAALDGLGRLVERCTQPDVAQRPKFAAAAAEADELVRAAAAAAAAAEPIEPAEFFRHAAAATPSSPRAAAVAARA